MPAALVTNFVKIAQSGPCADGRVIDPQWLWDMAETYDPAVYRAKIWPEHLRFGNNYGTVAALKAEESEGVVSLYARLAVNAQYVWDNQYDQKLSFSIELLENFAGTGKAYLGGLGVTDSPASLGTDELKFARRAARGGQNNARVYAGLPVPAASPAADLAQATEAPGWFAAFCNKFFSREEAPMDQKQIEAFNTRLEGLEAQLSEIKTLVEGNFAAAPAATTAPAAAGAPKPGTSQPDGKQPQGATGQDFSALTTALAASFKTALDPVRQKLDDMDKRFAAAKPGAPVAESTGPADESSPLI
ncbi:GPO family capsid scaffolding protein [uncultured Desulfovibrio sp.]|uniref:GPO family capsid scaffolding protein n=3 Tax=uncultured Desulfovibrio sp. TaxID=167968 RepID=UPI00266B7781|nr:GPO family capsid scaffolding protein [uncultured Desulfovibrio sp.]